MAVPSGKLWFGAVVALGALVFLAGRPSASSHPPLMLTPPSALTPPPTESSLSPTARETPIVRAVRKVRPGVVSIKAERRSPTRTREVVGTGVIVDERGYVVTTRHLVHDAFRLIAQLSDGTPVPCAVHADLPDSDLAVLRVDAGGKLPALDLANSSDLMEGETVIAIGHPFGYSYTISTGIVSARNREVGVGGVKLRGLIQTTASINPGNSGGPLLAIDGTLIGIVVGLQEGAQGIAFALEADAVRRAIAPHLPGYLAPQPFEEQVKPPSRSQIGR